MKGKGGGEGGGGLRTLAWWALTDKASKCVHTCTVGAFPPAVMGVCHALVCLQASRQTDLHPGHLRMYI